MTRAGPIAAGATAERRAGAPVGDAGRRGGSSSVGRSGTGGRAWPRPAEHGLTLLEMLIVLAVIAVASGATALALGPRRDDAPQVAARQLATAIEGAVDRSIATGARDTLVLDRGGYAVGGAHHPLAPALTVGGAGPAVPIALDAPPFDLTVADGRERWHVAFDGWRAVAARGGA